MPSTDWCAFEGQPCRPPVYCLAASLGASAHWCSKGRINNFLGATRLHYMCLDMGVATFHHRPAEAPQFLAVFKFVLFLRKTRETILFCRVLSVRCMVLVCAEQVMSNYAEWSDCG